MNIIFYLLVNAVWFNPIVQASDSAPNSWRCQNIPDEAFISLGSYKRKVGKAISKAEWRNRATKFILQYADHCPNYAALEKELPPWLLHERYTRILSLLYEFNRAHSVEELRKLASKNELEEHQKLRAKKLSAKGKKDSAFFKNFKANHKILEDKVEAAQLLIKFKYVQAK